MSHKSSSNKEVTFVFSDDPVVSNSVVEIVIDTPAILNSQVLADTIAAKNAAAASATTAGDSEAVVVAAETVVTDAEAVVVAAETVVTDAEAVVVAAETVVTDAEAVVVAAETVVTDAETVVVAAESATATSEANAATSAAAALASQLAAAAVAVAPMTGTYGRLANPLTHLPLTEDFKGKYQGALSFTRASTATYIDRYGVLKTAAAGIPRFEEKGLLVEGASTNLISHSTAFANHGWVWANLVVASGNGSPDGSTNAVLVTENDTSVGHSLNISVSHTSGEEYTTTVFAKSNGDDRQLKIQYTAGFGTSGSAIFDLDTGDVTFEITGTGKMTPLSDGWYRCEYTQSATVTQSSNVQLIMRAASLSGTDTYLGDGVSGFYLFGAQVEELPFASSYIPTAGTAATRSADGCSLSAVNNAPIPANGISIAARLAFLGYAETFTTAVRLKNTDTGKSVFTFVSNSSLTGNYSAALRADLEGSFIAHGSVGIGASEPVAYLDTVGGDTHNGYQNGVLVGSDTETWATQAANIIYIGSENGSKGIYGHLSDLRIYPYALTATEIKLLHGESA